MREIKAESIYQTIFDHAIEGIYLVTPDGNFVAANPVFAFLFGYESPEEIAAHISNPWLQLYCKPGHHEELSHMIMEHGIVRGFETKARRKDGSFILISENVHAVKDKTGAVIYFIGSVQDVTQRKGNQKAMQETEAHLRLLLEHADRDKHALLDIIDEICVSHRSLENTFINVVRDIVNALDSRRWWTRERSQRVAFHAVKIAEEMGFHEDEKSLLHIGALLHDIGQSVFCDELVDKPLSLTCDEYNIIRQHPVKGAAVLQKAKELHDVVPLIRHHHERIDGKGYPDGLQGDKIPLGARIIHVATTYDSIIADRPYRPAQSREYALKEIVRCANTQFDPKITEVALKVL